LRSSVTVCVTSVMPRTVSDNPVRDDLERN